MLFEHVHTHNGFVEVRVRALRDVIVHVLLVSQSVHTFEDEVEQGLQVLGARTRHEDVRVAVCQSGSDGQAQRGRLSSPTRCSERDSGRQCLFGDGIHEREDRLRLLDCLRKFDEVADRLGVR